VVKIAHLNLLRGVAESINFQDTGIGQSGDPADFVLTSDEVSPVISAFKENQSEITALHRHMLSEQPRLFFMHPWGIWADRSRCWEALRPLGIKFTLSDVPGAGSIQMLSILFFGS
jgi:hypothetical protein